MDERALDDAIDRAVREMMSVDAPGAITRRVLADVQPADARRLSWLAVSGGLSISAAAVILAFIVLPDSRNEPLTPRTPLTAAAKPEARNGPTVAGAGPARPPTSKSVPQPQERHVVAATVGDEELPHVDVPPLQRLEPIEVVPIDHHSFAPPPLAIRPLMPIAEVRVEPLPLVQDPFKGEL